MVLQPLDASPLRAELEVAVVRRLLGTVVLAEPAEAAEAAYCWSLLAPEVAQRSRMESMPLVVLAERVAPILVLALIPWAGLAALAGPSNTGF